MLALPIELLTRSRQLFLQCAEFETYKALRSVFITKELIPFRVGLRQADNPTELVDHFLDFILDKKISGGMPVFPIFLAALRDRYQEGDGQRDELDHLLEAVNLAVQNKQQIPTSNKFILFDRLLTLDFRPQVKLFREAIEDHRIASFLVHGPPEYGQRVLTHRLIRLKSEWSTGQKIIIDASSNGTGKNHQAIWRQIAKQMNLPFDTDIEILSERICQWWQTQDVIFVLYTVDYIPQHILHSWMQEFWQPVYQKAKESSHLTKRNTHLLLFLVDFSGEVCSTEMAFSEELTHLANSSHPLQLPPNCQFPEIELDIWIEAAAELLPFGLSADGLLASTGNGVPELVYEKIFDHCGLSWEGELPYD